MSELDGMRVMITRPRHQSQPLAALLESRGAIPLSVPAIEIAPMEDFAELDRALSQLGSYHWVVFTSVNGVEAVCQRLRTLGLGIPSTLRVAAIGPKTAAGLVAFDISTDFVPDEYVAEAILPGLDPKPGNRILLLRADIARPTLAEAIRQAGAVADDISVYRTIAASVDEQVLAEIQRGAQVLVFTSSSTVIHFLGLLERLGIKPKAFPGDPLIACIGPITAATAEAAGLRVDVIPGSYTIEGLVSALETYLTAQKQT